MSNPNAQIVIVIQNGVVQEVISSVPVVYVVDDADTDASPEHVQRPDLFNPGKTCTRLVTGQQDAMVDPSAVGFYMLAVKHESQTDC